MTIGEQDYRRGMTTRVRMAYVFLAVATVAMIVLFLTRGADTLSNAVAFMVTLTGFGLTSHAATRYRKERETRA